MIRILGIDPGYERLGIAILEKQSPKDKLLYSECFQTPKTLSHPERLLMIGERLNQVLETYSPTVLGIETLFFNTNQKTAMLVAETRGVILYMCAQKKLSLREFSPPQIKAATTGYGKADKKQVIDMVRRLIAISKEIKSDDEFDAIAVALTASATSGQLSP